MLGCLANGKIESRFLTIISGEILENSACAGA